MPAQNINNVTVCGAGVMGSWISAKIASSDVTTTLFDIESTALEKCRSSLPTSQKIPLTFSNNFEKSINQADLVIETIPEDLQLKRQFYLDLAKHVTSNTIVTSNTSIFLPTQFVDVSIKKSRFACFHFYAPNTAVDIMPLPETSSDTITSLTTFARHIGEEPVVLRKMTAGYLFSAMAGAATDVALSLIGNNVSDVENIDRSWMAITKMPIGPLGMLDRIGLDTSLKIRKQRLLASPDDEKLKAAIQVLEEYVSQGKLGEKTGIGFHEYRRPE